MNVRLKLIAGFCAVGIIYFTILPGRKLRVENFTDHQAIQIKDNIDLNFKIDSMKICDINLPMSESDLQRKIEINEGLDVNFTKISVWNERLRKVEKYCENFKEELSLSEVVNLLAKKIVVDSFHKVLYAPVPKTGTTNWKKVMAHATHVKFYYLNNSDVKSIKYPRQPGILTYLSSIPPKHRIQMLKEYFVYTNVREPFHRLLSAFLNKFTSTKDPYFRQRYGKFMKDAENTFKTRVNPSTTGTKDGVTYTFRSFIRYLANTDPKKYNGHWQTYTSRLHPCSIKYNFIGKLETMEQDFNYISQCHVKEGTYKETFPPSYSHDKHETFENYYKSADKHDLYKVYQIFRGDSELFGYEVPEIVLSLVNGVSALQSVF